MGEARRMCFAMRESEKTASPEWYRHPLRCRSRVETDFCIELGDRKASANTGIADSVAHELFHPAVTAPPRGTPTPPHLPFLPPGAFQRACSLRWRESSS